jgi:hypothetical protein
LPGEHEEVIKMETEPKEPQDVFEENIEEDIYSYEGTEEQLDNGEISSEEAGFMLGYNMMT